LKEIWDKLSHYEETRQKEIEHKLEHFENLRKLEAAEKAAELAK